MKQIEIDYFDQKLAIETGKLAKQSDGSVLVSYGNTRVLVTAVADKTAKEDINFFPLTCIYQIKTYSQGKINGGFIKRESKPTELETLISRQIDRPLRPLFPEDFKNETQIIATVLSYDENASPEAAAILGASTALGISDIPFAHPVAGITVGYIDGEFVQNPSPETLKNSDLNLFMVASKDAIVMVESEANQLEERILLEALSFGFKSIQPLIELQEKFIQKVGKKKRAIPTKEIDQNFKKTVDKWAKPKLTKALKNSEKLERYSALDEVKVEAVEKFVTEEQPKELVTSILEELKKKIIRDSILKTGKRIDGRKITEIRPITCEIGLLPKVHGSALFTRGETQALVTTTLGTKDDEQMVDDATGLHYKNFFLHYNFPPYSVGEVGRMGPPGRREIGHGTLAERGLKSVLPDHTRFPYTIRIVSEILESNGSSSMASVCGGSLAMMDAGIPVEAPTAGIAMGMIYEDKKNAILSDILGDEDHVGDMDFKVVGTEKGITALQMDIKIQGLSQELLEKSLMQAKEGRLHILKEMKKTISEAKQTVSSNAPRFIQQKIPTNKIRSIIGPGGSVIKGITAESGAKVEVDDSGMVNIASNNQESAEKALALIRELIKEVEIGTTYNGKVKKIMEFGAFVEVLPTVEGLVHISEVSDQKISNIKSILNEGQSLKVKAIGFDKRGKLKLSARNV